MTIVVRMSLRDVLINQHDVLINQLPDCLSRIKSWMDLYSLLKLKKIKTEIIVLP